MKKIKIITTMLLCLFLLFGCKVESVKQHLNATADSKPISLIQRNLDESESSLTKLLQHKQPETKEEAIVQEKEKEPTNKSESKPAQGNVSNQQESGKPNVKQFVTFSIDVKTILNNKDKLKPNKVNYVPDNGIILQAMQVEINGNETVFDLLKKITNEYRIKLAYQGSEASAYIIDIANLEEFDCGDLSGWMYTVNGSYVNASCGAKSVSNGDVIRWVFTCDNGRDIY
ncbi:MAG: DUF4430 domain-containing protein [Erysipelotrichaceae bacterium]